MSNWLFANPLNRAVTIYLGIVCSLLIGGLLLKPIIFPLLFSLILYIMLQPLTDKLICRGFSQMQAITTVMGVLTLSLIGSLFILAPLLLEQITEFQHRIPILWNTVSDQINNLGIWLSNKTGVSIDPQSMISSALNDVQNLTTSALLGSANLMLQLATGLILVPIICFFLLKDYRSFRYKVMSWLPNRGFELGWLIYYRVTKQLQRYLRGVMIQSTIIAVITTIGFFIIDIEMAVLFGSLTGLLNLIPYVGPLLAMLPPLFLTLGSGSLDPFMISGIIAVILSAQFIDNLVIVPSFIASTVNLHPLTTILGIIIFGYLFGFLGMLIAIPVMAISKILFISLLLGLHGKTE